MTVTFSRASPVGAPEIVCWSRMQTEAGQGLSSIIRRKELERRSCDGVFFWGVGNAPSRFTQSLVAARHAVPVVFSVMRSPPKSKDVAPSAILIWRSYIDGSGKARAVPEGSLVTSRYSGGDQPRHYALMCQSEAPLCLSDYGCFDPMAYRNLGEGGGQIAASQVTTLVTRVTEEREAAPYRRNLQAQLSGNYWVKLSDPLLITGDALQRVMDDISDEALTVKDWLDLIYGMKIGEGLARHNEPNLPLLRALH